MNAKLIVIAASLTLWFAAGAYAQTPPATSGSSGQQSQEQQTEQQHKAAMEKCDGMKENAKEICKAEADGMKTVAEAQAKVAERDTPKNRLDLEKAKAEAQFKVAKARCGDQVGDARKACEKEAKAMQDLAVAQAEKQSLTQTSSGGGASGSSSAAQPTTTPPSSEQPKPPSQ